MKKHYLHDLDDHNSQFRAQSKSIFCKILIWPSSIQNKPKNDDIELYRTFLYEFSPGTIKSLSHDENMSEIAHSSSQNLQILKFSKSYKIDNLID